MNWEIYSKDPAFCWKHRDSTATTTDEPDVSNPWFLCVKPLIPGRKIARFKYLHEYSRLSKQLDLYDNKVEKVEDIVVDGEDTFGYKQPCNGDSGHGSWVFDTKLLRATLVAIHSMNTICGMEPGLAIKISYSPFHKWIKKHANIPTTE